MAEQRYFVARPFKYGPDSHWLDVGQVTKTLDQPGDERLIRLEYFRKLDGRVKTYPCGQCGAEFIDMNTLNGHGNIRHEGLSDKRAKEELAQAAAVASARFPLNIENTEASRTGRRTTA